LLYCTELNILTCTEIKCLNIRIYEQTKATACMDV